MHLGDPDAFIQFQVRPRQLAFPRSDAGEFERVLETFARNMILDENKFMEEINRMVRKGALTRDLREKERVRFNKSANRLCLDLDRQIVSFLGLAKEDQGLIATTMKAIEMADFGFSELEESDG